MCSRPWPPAGAARRSRSRSDSPMTPPRAAAPLASAAFAVSAVALLALGCSSDRPKAPPLTNEAVYQNDKIGLRFLTPEGWKVTARTDLPPGQLPRPVT